MQLILRLLCFTLLVTLVQISLQDRYTNVKCTSLDPSFGEFKVCRLKLVKRGVIGLNLYIALLKVPVNNITVNVSLWRKFSGYRFFLYNQTVDFCKFMIEKRKLSFTSIVINGFGTNSNINHTCPYSHDLIVNNNVFLADYLRFIPLPAGEYKIQVMLAAYNEWKGRLDIFFDLNNSE